MAINYKNADELRKNSWSYPTGGGSGGIQPDLNQNDPEAADYVKGRTHWSEYEWTHVATSSMDASFIVKDTSDSEPFADYFHGMFVISQRFGGQPTNSLTDFDELHRIEIDGHHFEGILRIVNGIPCLGNPLLYGLWQGRDSVESAINRGYFDTGEDFVLCQAMFFAIRPDFVAQCPFTAPISVYKSVEVAHPIDLKYIPDNIGADGFLRIVKDENNHHSTNITYDKFCSYIDEKTFIDVLYFDNSTDPLVMDVSRLYRIIDKRGYSIPCFDLYFKTTDGTEFRLYFKSNGAIETSNPNSGM